MALSSSSHPASRTPMVSIHHRDERYGGAPEFSQGSALIVGPSRSFVASSDRRGYSCWHRAGSLVESKPSSTPSTRHPRQRGLSRSGALVRKLPPARLDDRSAALPRQSAEKPTRRQSGYFARCALGKALAALAT